MYLTDLSVADIKISFVGNYLGCNHKTCDGKIISKVCGTACNVTYLDGAGFVIVVFLIR